LATGGEDLGAQKKGEAIWEEGGEETTEQKKTKGVLKR